MCKIKNIVSTPHLRILYQSSIEPCLTYSCTKSHVRNRNKVIQNVEAKVLRLNAKQKAINWPLRSAF